MSEARRYQQLRGHFSYLKLDNAAEALRPQLGEAPDRPTAGPLAALVLPSDVRGCLPAADGADQVHACEPVLDEGLQILLTQVRPIPVGEIRSHRHERSPWRS
jgi:hypothetical protein